MTEASLLLRVHEAASLLGISRSTAYELIARGELPYMRLGGVLRVPRAGLETWITQMTRVGSGETEDAQWALSLPIGQGGRLP